MLERAGKLSFRTGYRDRSEASDLTDWPLLSVFQIYRSVYSTPTHVKVRECALTVRRVDNLCSRARPVRRHGVERSHRQWNHSAIRTIYSHSP
jgi:hypothetical protein